MYLRLITLACINSKYIGTKMAVGKGSGLGYNRKQCGFFVITICQFQALLQLHSSDCK